MKLKSFLGIDTSNYMTSICFIDENRRILYEGKELLQVKEGETGLQQSEALFQHIKNLPRLFQKAEVIRDYTLEAIAVSRAPRPEEGSYMPVFIAGISVAESMAAVLNIPLYGTTHQEGHISAGIYSGEKQIMSHSFLAVHLSGGTSEILHVEKKEAGYGIKKLGGTLDLHAGQLIDRIGVMLGLPFPAGKYFEELARKSLPDFKRIPSSVKEFSFHFSGAEAEAKRRIEQGALPQEIARSIEHVIAASLEKGLKTAIEAGLPKDILLVGGVAQNQYIRDHLLKKLENSRTGARLYFADPSYSGDNAFGTANLALDHYRLRTVQVE